MRNPIDGLALSAKDVMGMPNATGNMGRQRYQAPLEIAYQDSSKNGLSITPRPNDPAVSRQFAKTDLLHLDDVELAPLGTHS